MPLEKAVQRESVSWREDCLKIWRYEDIVCSKRDVHDVSIVLLFHCCKRKGISRGM